MNREMKTVKKELKRNTRNPGNYDRSPVPLIGPLVDSIQLK